MLKFKQLVYLKYFKLRLKSYLKYKPIYGKLIKYTTKRILINKAPKHFNIGQHSLKVRSYFSEQIIHIPETYFGCGISNPTSNLIFKQLIFNKKFNIRSVTIYYSSYFKI